VGAPRFRRSDIRSVPGGAHPAGDALSGSAKWKYSDTRERASETTIITRRGDAGVQHDYHRHTATLRLRAFVLGSSPNTRNECGHILLKTQRTRIRSRNTNGTCGAICRAAARAP